MPRGEKSIGFDGFPKYVRSAILNALYRGDLGPKTISLINQGKWSKVKAEYLNHDNYKNPGRYPGVRTRMQENGNAFEKYANELAKSKSNSNPGIGPSKPSKVHSGPSKPGLHVGPPEPDIQYVSEPWHEDS